MLRSETDLHIKVVKFIRANYPNILIDAGLGELQDSSEKRIEAWKKGYTAGKPDLLIFNHSGPWSGFAIEFKNPVGYGFCNEKQLNYMEKLASIGWKIMLTKSYSKCVKEIKFYCENVDKTF